MKIDKYVRAEYSANVLGTIPILISLFSLFFLAALLTQEEIHLFPTLLNFYFIDLIYHDYLVLK